MQNPLSYAAHYLTALTTKFWQQEGSLQTYMEFLLTEIDPMLSRHRNAAEVVQIVQETSDSKTFILRPSSHWPGFNAGQYINLELEINGVRVRRNYSISSSPNLFKNEQKISITVKEIEGGRVSSYLHRHIKVGDILHIGAACGDFSLTHSADSPLNTPLFIAAGSGITPIVSMISSLTQAYPEQEMTLIYYVRSQEDLIFRDQLFALAKATAHFTFIPHYTEHDGYISPQQLLADCPDIDKRTVYLCGPTPFMSAVENHANALGVKEEAILQESFGSPLHALAIDNQQSSGQVHFINSGKTIASSGDKTLLELAESAGLNPKYGCRSGICHECKCNKTEGQVFNTLTGELVPVDQSQIQACISVPVGNISISSL